MEITKLKARSFSRLGQRGTIFGMMMPEIAGRDDRTIVFSADLASLSGLDRFIGMYPDKFYNIGIAEQNMLGVAAGFASEGYKSYATTYATFITLRSCEQMRHYMGLMRSNIVLIGSGAGLIMTYSGNTHYSIEDIAVCRSIPNIIVVSPSDASVAAKCIEAASRVDHPVYIRLTGGLNCPIIYTEDFDFTIGKAIELRQGGDVAIIATGTMVANALESANILVQFGIECSVIDMHTIKPLDFDAVKSTFNVKLIVTVEEHNVIGGLGGAVAECLSQFSNSPRLLRIGIEDTFLKPADYTHLLQQCGLTPEQISDKIKQTLNEANKL